MRPRLKRLSVVLAALSIGGAGVVAGVLAAPDAHASNNGLSIRPAMGWSSWSFVRRNPTATIMNAQADAMKHSGLADHGYLYVNLDDFFQKCDANGFVVDNFGRWTPDTGKFPGGIKPVADHIHSLGLKFGLYVTPGIPQNAVTKNTPIEGTSFHAKDIADTSKTEKNYSCKHMYFIDYSKPGAQEYVNSFANLYASWGVDYLKIDGVGASDIPDVQAWDKALRQANRPINYALSNNLPIANATTWKQLSNSWRTQGDVECYCSGQPNGVGFPLTDWAHVSSRFNQVANWQPYGGPGGFNDYDSIEVGNGANTGLTVDERRTQLSLWALAASPFILGTDLTNLDPTDLELLKNRDVLAVDQDAIDASRVASANGQQVFAKKEQNGDVVVGLFNTTTSAQVVSATAAALGLPAADAYLLLDLWTHLPQETAGQVSATVPAHGVALFRVRPTRLAKFLPPTTTLGVAGLATGGPAGQPLTATASFTDDGVQPVQHVRLALSAPAGWAVTATSPVRFDTVAAGQTVQATFQVVPPPPAKLFESDLVTATADYLWYGIVPFHLTSRQTVTSSQPVQAPFKTFSSTTAAFAQRDTRLGIQGAGRDVFGTRNEYGAIYQPGAMPDGTVATVQVTAQANTNAWAKAGIIVRNDITNAGASPGFLILAEAPGHGYVMQWDANGDGQLDSNSAPSGEGLGTAAYPSWLKLVRNGTAYTGWYSTDGSTWTWIDTVSLPSAAATQDVGMFMTAHTSGTLGEVDFDHFGLAAAPPSAWSYEAEAQGPVAPATVQPCAACSGGSKVSGVGNDGSLTFNVAAPAAGTYPVTLAYLDGSATGLQAAVSVNGGAAQTVTFPPTGSFDVSSTVTVSLPLVAGGNTIRIGNPAGPAPDLDRIIVSAPSG